MKKKIPTVQDLKTRFASAATPPPQRNGKAPPPAEWPEPLPLDDAQPGPPFPVERLPDWFAAWVIAESESTQTPPDLSAMLGLGIGGAGLARKFRVQIRPGWGEPLNTYSAVSLLSGERKSAVVADATEPVQEFERREIERMAPIIAEAESERRIFETRVKVMETKAAKEEDATERDRLRHEAKQAARELAALPVPESPVLVCDDETPESLGRLLAIHNGRMLLASAEGTTFEIAKGRYSETANFDVFLKAHAGDELRVGRISREREHIAYPALTMAVAIQPDVVRGLAESASMRQRGFLARFMYSIPRSRVGQRTIAARPVPANVVANYRIGMLALWGTTYPATEHGEYAAHWLKFSPAADEVLRGLEHWLEPQLGEGGELFYLSGWANKLAGLVARVSGVLHMMQAIGADANWNTPICPETVENAVAIGKEYLLPHAQVAFAVMGADSKVSLASEVWESIVRRCVCRVSSVCGVATFTRRDAHNWNQKLCPKVEDLDPLLQILEDYGYVSSVGGSGGVGKGKKSPMFEVSPLALESSRRKSATRIHSIHGIHTDAESEPALVVAAIEPEPSNADDHYDFDSV